MTAEVAFAKSFLASLDSKPVKLQSDYAADPKTLELNGSVWPSPLRLISCALPVFPPFLRPSALPNTSPALTPLQYTLPRFPHSMQRPTTSSTTGGAPGTPANPGAAPAATVTLRTLRGTPPLDLALPATPLTTSILELKARVAAELGIAEAQVRILHNKKPCADAKTVKDVLGGEAAKAVELSVMVMGAAGKEKEAEAPAPAPAAQGESGAGVMEGKGFWEDLGGFLEQRVKDAEVARKARRLFEEAWREKGQS